MTKPLLVEIGTEEIPAGYIAPALDFFGQTLRRRLEEARIGFGDIRTYGTPMRLAVSVAGVAERQEAATSEVLGPPESVGFDADGRPTVAAVKFAEKVGVDVSRIRVADTPRGRYLCAEKTESAMDSAAILGQMLPEIVLSLPFPKTMRWADLSITFARPIRWLVALLGDAVVSFEVGNLSSGRTSRGHRFLSPEPVDIPHAEAYLEAMEAAKIAVDPEARRESIAAEVRRAAEGLGGKVLEDPELVDTVTHLVEYPVVLAGRFEDRFLELPDEVLITSMREHQKYFAVAGDGGGLLPRFIVVSNTRARDMEVVARGNERVLRARLEDALFFYKNDLQTPMDELAGKLTGVLFQAKLGTMHQKVERVRALSSDLAEMAGGDAALRADAERAASICKADLLSQVVVEFPKLQGVMGRIYARKAGESEAVCTAIEEHYRPTHSGGALPGTLTGTLLAVADKLDTLCGCFSVGLVPTGASDPYALRRQTIGMVLMLRDRNLDLSIGELIRRCLAAFETQAEEPLEAVAGKVYGFFRDRISHILVEEGYAKDTVAAVTSVSVDRIPQVWRKVEALASLREADGFEPLAVAFKRVGNIVRKARQDEPDLDLSRVDAGRFEADCERELEAAYRGVRTSVDDTLARGDFAAALATIAMLRAPVDDFFEGVMVMAEDPAIRRNRLALLAQVGGLFESIADFSKFSV